MFLFACGTQHIDDTDYENIDTANSTIDSDITCTDERGYKHRPKTFWQCDGLCATCGCAYDGSIYIVSGGLNIVTEECITSPEQPRPPFPK